MESGIVKNSQIIIEPSGDLKYDLAALERQRQRLEVGERLDTGWVSVLSAVLGFLKNNYAILNQSNSPEEFEDQKTEFDSVNNQVSGWAFVQASPDQTVDNNPELYHYLQILNTAIIPLILRIEMIKEWKIANLLADILTESNVFLEYFPELRVAMINAYLVSNIPMYAINLSIKPIINGKDEILQLADVVCGVTCDIEQTTKQTSYEDIVQVYRDLECCIRFANGIVEAFEKFAAEGFALPDTVNLLLEKYRKCIKTEQELINLTIKELAKIAETIILSLKPFYDLLNLVIEMSDLKGKAPFYILEDGSLEFTDCLSLLMDGEHEREFENWRTICRFSQVISFYITKANIDNSTQEISLISALELFKQAEKKSAKQKPKRKTKIKKQTQN
jgi:hypothetical protein